MISKKGQITLFVIIGIVILIGASILFYVSRPEEEEIITIEETKTTLSKDPITKIVDDCIRRIVNKNMAIMSMQSGYLKIPNDIETLEIDSNKEAQVLWESEAVKTFKNPAAINTMPFWVTKTRFKPPYLEDIEKELSAQLSTELELCVNNFDSLKEQGYEITSGKITSDIKLKNQVITKVTFPITASKGNDVIEVSDFIYSLPVNFERIYDIAYGIGYYEQKNSFLESHAMQLISLYQYRGGSKEKYSLPPLTLSEVNFHGNFEEWQLIEVENSLKTIFANNFPLIKIKGTLYEPIIGRDEIAQGVYDGYEKNFFRDSYPNTRIDLIYDPQYKLNLDIKPRSGSSILPDSVSKASKYLIPFININTYEFKYSFNSPVIVSIIDYDSAAIDPLTYTAEPGKGFAFEFPLMLWVCGNNYKHCIDLERPNITGFFETLTELNLSAPEDIGFCDYDYRVNKNFTVQVFDKKNNPISNARIFYECTDYSCMISKTNETGSAFTKFPPCINGRIKIYADNHSVLSQRLTISKDSPGLLDYVLGISKELNVSLRIIHLPTFIENYYKSDGFTKDCQTKTAKELFEESYFLPGTDDEIIISLNTDEEITGMPVIIYPTNTQLSFTQGNYEIESIYKTNMTINASIIEREGEDPLIVDFDDDPDTIKPYIGPWMMGKGMYNISIKEPDVDDNNRILLYAFADNKPTDSIEILDLNKIEFDNSGFSYTVNNFDHDCDISTDPIKKNLNLTTEQISEVLKPELS